MSVEELQEELARQAAKAGASGGSNSSELDEQISALTRKITKYEVPDRERTMFVERSAELEYGNGGSGSGDDGSDAGNFDDEGFVDFEDYDEGVSGVSDKTYGLGIPDDAEGGYGIDESGEAYGNGEYDDPDERALAELFGGVIPEGTGTIAGYRGDTYYADLNGRVTSEYTAAGNESYGESGAEGSGNDGNVISRKTTAVDIRGSARTTNSRAGGAGGADARNGNMAPQELSPEDQQIRDRIIQRKKDNAERNRRRRRQIRFILIAVLTAIVLFIFSLSSFFTVDMIEVTGNDHFTGEEIRNIAHAVPGRNILYNAGKTDMISYLEQNPYIKTAEVERRLPSTLVITVTERQQICAFQYDNDYLIMDDEGILLKKTRNKPKITMVEGMVVSKLKLGEEIGTTDSKQFRRILKLMQSMRDADMYFVRVDMNDTKNVGAYIYDNMIVRTDYDTLVANLKNGRLHKVVGKLLDDGIKRGTITFASDGSASFEPGI